VSTSLTSQVDCFRPTMWLLLSLVLPTVLARSSTLSGPPKEVVGSKGDDYATEWGSNGKQAFLSGDTRKVELPGPHDGNPSTGVGSLPGTHDGHSTSACKVPSSNTSSQSLVLFKISQTSNSILLTLDPNHPPQSEYSSV
jgi:hypothetical protein